MDYLLQIPAMGKIFRESLSTFELKKPTRRQFKLLARFEFFECLIRLGVYKYFINGMITDRLEAVIVFFDEIVANIPSRCL